MEAVVRSAFLKDHLREQTRLYINGVVDRLVPAFAHIEEEADDAANKAWQMAMDTPTYYDDVDPATIAEAAQEHGLAVYSGLRFLQREVFNSAAAGLYHLWEKLTKELLRHSSSWSPPIRLDAQSVEKAKHNEVVDFYRQSGTLVSATTDAELETLRLVANVHKHGHGPSFDALIDRDLTLFENMERPLVRPEDLFVSESRFSQFGTSVLEFWNAVPNYLEWKGD